MRGVRKQFIKLRPHEQNAHTEVKPQHSRDCGGKIAVQRVEVREVFDIQRVTERKAAPANRRADCAGDTAFERFFAYRRDSVDENEHHKQHCNPED